MEKYWDHIEEQICKCTSAAALYVYINTMLGRNL
jgi:hypothetical protein